MAKKTNRLASLFTDFTGKFELPSKVDSDGLGADLGIPDGRKVISASYAFDQSEDSYEYGAVLGQVEKSHSSAFSASVMTSEPIRGITERIDDQGRYYVVGSRDGLKSRSDAEVQKGYMDDVSRIARSNDQYKGLKRRLFGGDR